MAQLLHLVLKVSHLDFPQLSVLCMHLYLQQLGVKHYHMRLVLYFALTTDDCDYQVTRKFLSLNTWPQPAPIELGGRFAFCWIKRLCLE